MSALETTSKGWFTGKARCHYRDLVILLVVRKVCASYLREWPLLVDCHSFKPLPMEWKCHLKQELTPALECFSADRTGWRWVSHFLFYHEKFLKLFSRVIINKICILYSSIKCSCWTCKQGMPLWRRGKGWGRRVTVRCSNCLWSPSTKLACCCFCTDGCSGSGASWDPSYPALYMSMAKFHREGLSAWLILPALAARSGRSQPMETLMICSIFL